MSQYYSNLINNEQYHFDEINIHYQFTELYLNLKQLF